MKARKKKKVIRYFSVSFALIIAFIIWTACVVNVDLGPIGVGGSMVGLSSINGPFHIATGEHLGLYTATDILSVIPIAICIFFAVFGVAQLIARKSLFKVDRDIIILGIFYIVVIAFFLMFERIVINYRPILIDGKLELSYPSSTTLLTVSVMLSAFYQVKLRIKNPSAKLILYIGIIAFTAFMVIARLVSGVHWLSDIIGGLFLSLGLVMLMISFATLFSKRKRRRPGTKQA